MIANKSLFCLFSLVSSATAFTVNPPASASSTTQLQAVARDDFLKSMAVAVVGTTGSALFPTEAAFAETLENGVSYTVKKEGTGPKPVLGDLVAIRFAAFAGANKIDDIFDTPEPYYTRIGTGGLLKGVEATLPLMRVGDRWELTIPSNLAFGPKGRPASAGKPRISGDQTIVFDVEMVGLPGKEEELIELIGNDL